MASLEPGLTPPLAASADVPALTVSQLNRAAREILERGFGDVWVRGEISRFLAHGSGHWYFTLKDDGACISAAMFRGANRNAKCRPADGMEVLVRGKVSLYEQRGSYQIIVEHVEPAGEGALFVAFEKLKRKLADEGLFDAARKRKLPLLPRRIGIATSTTGAALHDMLRVLAARGARLHVVIAACRVQGDGAAEEIAGALGMLDRLGGLDAVIVGRGGGSVEDLWAFNEEVVARAIAAMRVPTISAVGHEIDVTIADFVADVRAATPSQAAELVSASALELSSRLHGVRARLAQSLRSRCAEARTRATRVEPRRVGSRLLGRVERLGQHVDHLDRRLDAAIRGDLRRARLRLGALSGRLQPEHWTAVLRGRRERLLERMRRLDAAVRARVSGEREACRLRQRALEALSPLAVLERGYAVIHRADGAIVRAASDVDVGETLRARLAEGAISVNVLDKHTRAEQAS